MSDVNRDHPLDMLSSYLDDELPADQRAPIDRHLAFCLECRDHLNALRRLSRAVAEDAVPAVPDDLEARVLRRLDVASVIPMRRRRFVIPASIAATIAAVSLVAVVTWKQGGVGVAPRQEHASQQADTERLRDKARTEAPATVAQSATQIAQPVAAPPAPRPADAPTVTSAKEKRNEFALDRPADNLAKTDRGVQGAAESKDEKELDSIGRLAGGAPAAGDMPEGMGAMKAAAAICSDAADDSGVGSNWEVADLVTAVRDLDALAVTLGGRLQRPGAAPDAPFTVVLPRARYQEFVTAAREMGITGLDGHRVGVGATCIGQRVAIGQAAPR